MLAAWFCISVSGCASWQVPSLAVPGAGMSFGLTASADSDQERYQPVGSDVSLAPASLHRLAYQKVRQAKAQHAVVLQVVGDEEPLRVLPLPPPEGSGPAAGRTVFVSSLLDQTGVKKKLGRIEASLFRADAGSLNGIRMDVQFANDSSGSIRPETDYALRPGDRLVVKKAEAFNLERLLDMALAR